MKKYWLVLTVVILLFTIGTSTAVFADKPAEGRVGRSEVRFMEGMIDHHQMAIDMAQDCLHKAKTEAVVKQCQAIIDAQTPEIKILRGWLLSWYQIDYDPMSMAHMMDMMQSHHSSGMMGDMHGGMHMGSGQQSGGAHNNAAPAQATDDHHPTDEAGSEHSTAEATAQAGGHSTSGMMGMMPDDMPMMMGMMAGLSKLEGTEYEVAWLEAMIDHHDDAVHMSQRILKNAEHPQLRELAEKIIKDQTAEIATLEQLIGTLTK